MQSSKDLKYIYSAYSNMQSSNSHKCRLNTPTCLNNEEKFKKYDYRLIFWMGRKVSHLEVRIKDTYVYYVNFILIKRKKEHTAQRNNYSQPFSYCGKSETVIVNIGTKIIWLT